MGLPVYSYEIGFPKDKNISLTLDGVFFAGKVEQGEEIWINNQKILPQCNGAFAESFRLNLGENIFYIRSSKNKQQDKYVVNYVNVKDSNYLITFPIVNFRTIYDNVVLRSTPFDMGMNRIGYLPKNTDLKIIGYKNNFSKVYLNDNASAWVMTKHITPDYRNLILNGKFENKKEQEYKDRITITYKFNKNLPYSLIFKDNLLLLDVYNVANCSAERFEDQILLNYPYCYSYEMKNGELIISILKNKLKDKNIKIVLDAGHGGHEIGAVGCLSDKEKNMNLRAVKAIRKELKSQKYKVYMTRKNDRFVSLTDRINYAKNKKALIFISMHMNSVPENVNPNNHKGSEIYYYNDFSKSLAEAIQPILTEKLGTRDNGIIQASYAVIRPTEYIGILVETAYMVNPDDTKIYKSKDFFKKVGVSITNGVTEYVKNVR